MARSKKQIRRHAAKHPWPDPEVEESPFAQVTADIVTRGQFNLGSSQTDEELQRSRFLASTAGLLVFKGEAAPSPMDVPAEGSALAEAIAAHVLADAEVQRLRDELAALQASNIQRPYDAWQGDSVPVPVEGTRVVLRTNKDWDNLAQARSTQKKRGGGILVAAASFAAALTLYVGMDLYGIQVPLPGLSSIIASNLPQSAGATNTAPIEEKAPAAVLSHGANLRGGPNMTAAVITALPTGAEVTPLETSGNWTLVRISGGREGWIYSEFLQQQAETTAAKSAPPKTKLR